MPEPQPRPPCSAEDAARASRRAVDATTSLPGEDTETGRPEDINHWIAVYGELVAYKEALLATSGASIDRMSMDAARQESQSVDVVILQFQLEKYRDRLDFWAARRAELPDSRF